MADKSKEEDPRIETMIAQAKNTTELILNAEFLLDAWITAFLKLIPNAYEAVRVIGMTAEQRFYLAAGYLGCFDEVENGGQVIFTSLSRIYRIRAKVGRLSADELELEMQTTLCDAWDDEMSDKFKAAPERLEVLRGLMKAYFCFAFGYIDAVIQQESE